MPIFGEETEVLALSLDASIRGPDNPFGDDNEKNDIQIYYAPAGYIITEIRSHIKNDQGYTWNLYSLSTNPPDFTLKFERFNEELRIKTGDFFDAVIAHEKIKSQYDKLVQNNSWSRSFTGHARAIAGVGSTSKIWIDYYAKLMYVGNEVEINNLLDSWLAGISVEKRFSLNEYRDNLQFLNTTNHLIEGKLLIVNNGDINTETGSVFLDTAGLPVGSVGTFNAHLGTFGSPKICSAVIWEQQPHTNKSSGEIKVDAFQDLSVTNEITNTGNSFKFEIYYNNNVEGDTVIDLDLTTATLTKTFE